MKTINAKIALLVLTAAASVLRLPAAVPLSWTVETTRAQPATFEAYQGETLTFEAALQSRGKPLEAPLNYSFFWQTNGMGNAYWEAPAQGGSGVSPLVGGTNVLFATWLPAYDVGAKVYNCFIGSPSNIYHAAFQLRLRPSPGATPNALPLPTPVIDFAKVRVLNPPWSGGGVDTNAVRDIIRETVDGAARPLPKYLHALDFDDSYPAEAAWYYAQPQDYGACSARRVGNLLERNYDWKFDDAAEFVVKVNCSSSRFASVGVANCGTNLTEEIVTSGKPSRYYKCLPGRVVDGINENGVVAEVNVVDGKPVWHTEPTDTPIHPLAAVRWILDNATNAQSAAEFIAANIRFPQGWTQDFHYMVADERGTWVVEHGNSAMVNRDQYPRAVMTNYSVVDSATYFPELLDGEGRERLNLLFGGANITNAWYTLAYRRETNPPWVTDLRDVLAYTNEIFDAWATHPKEYFRNRMSDGTNAWWQTLHTSVYDLTNRTLRVAVQETDDWYVFQVPASGGGVSPDAVREIVDPMIHDATTGVRIAASEDAERMLTRKDAADFGTPDEFSVVGRITNKDVKLVVTNGYMSIEDKTNTVYTTRRVEEKAQAASDRVSELERLAVGSNVVFSVTNATSASAIDLNVGKLKIRELLGAPGADSWHGVYDSREEIVAHQTNYDAQVVQPGFASLSGRVTATSNWVERTKAPIGWGAVASDGLPAPTNTVVIRAPSTVFAGGHAFERVNVGTGTVGILVNRGAPTYTGEPGTFRFRDAMTGEYFGYTKNTYTLGCNTDGISVDPATHMVTLTYNVTMSSYPIVKYVSDLEDFDPDEWEPLNDVNGDPIPGASHGIAWEDPDPEPGKKVCHINCTEAQGFFTAEVAGIDGDCRFETNMAAEFKGGIVAHDVADTNVAFAVEIVVEEGQPKLRIK